MKNILFAALLALCICKQAQAQNQAIVPEIVYIRIQEGIKMSALESTMVVIKPDNSTETTVLKKLGYSGSAMDENGILIKKEIEKWLSKGFKIVSNNSAGGDAVTRTEILLQKIN